MKKTQKSLRKSKKTIEKTGGILYNIDNVINPIEHILSRFYFGFHG